MANTFSQIYIHVVFAVKGRQSLISASHREELHKYITGIVQNRGQKMLAVFSMPDHTHLLIGMEPSMSPSDLVREVKAISSKHINEQKWVIGKFNWQEGFGAFSYGKSQVKDVIKYILNQEEHHKARSFKEEYLEILNRFEVTYDEKYLFDWIDEQSG